MRKDGFQGWFLTGGADGSRHWVAIGSPFAQPMRVEPTGGESSETLGLPVSSRESGIGETSAASGRNLTRPAATLSGAGRDWASIVANGDARIPLSS